MSEAVNKVKQKVRAPNGKKVPFDELLSPTFMQSQTRFKNLDAFVKHANITDEQFLELSEVDQNTFVRGQTRFASWVEMLSLAGAEYVQKQSANSLKVGRKAK